MMDWSDGEYEHTARELLPVSETLVASLGELTGRRALDLGCGTGNAAVALARRGADVVAVDPAARLLEVTRKRAAAEGLRVRTELGDASAIPLPDRSVDLLVSVFAVIFAPDAEVAVREMLRVLADGGRIVVTSWTSDGAIARAGRLLRDAMTPPGEPPRPGPAWGDEAWVEALFARHGGHAKITRAEVPFEDASARAWLDRQVELHPIWRAIRRAHDGRPEAWQRLYDAMLSELERGAERSANGRWRVTSAYLVIDATRSGT